MKTRFENLIGLALVAAILVAATGLIQLRKDSSVDALVPKDSDTLLLRDRVQAQFGLKDPIVVALSLPEAGGLWSPAALEALRDVSEMLIRLPGVDPDQVFSLATAQWVHSEGDSLVVEPLLPEGPISEDAVVKAQRGLSAMPMLTGTLVAQDGSAALIAAELRNDADPGVVYLATMQALASLPLPPGMEIHVAGEATTNGYLSRYIDRDAELLTPVGAVLMLLLVGLFVRSWLAVLAGAVVLLGTLMATIGLMGLTGSPIYIITSCLPAVLLCVAIADTIHYLWRLQRLLQREPDLDFQTAVWSARRALWRPLLLSSLTTAAGFLGLATSSAVPPMRDYGLFAAIGVMVAWALTLFVVPAMLVRFKGSRRALTQPIVTFAFPSKVRLPTALARRPTTVLLVALGLVGLASLGAGQVIADEERILNFDTTSPVYQADRLLNERFAGAHYLDLYLSAAPGSSLTDPAAVEAIAGLQAWMTTQGVFGASVSFVDTLRAISAATGGHDPQAAPLPKTQDEAEQWLFLFEISGKPGDLRQEINADRTEAYVRGHLSRNAYRHALPIMAALEVELRQRLAPLGIESRLTGPVSLTTAWFAPLMPQMAMGMLLALSLVLMLSALVLRSLQDGLLCLIPVASAILLVFGLMGAMDIHLSVATSMFASISIGLGVDFAIHVLHALREGRKQGLSGEALTQWMYGDVGGPLTANAVVLAIGFSVTMLSVIPPLRSFGLLMIAVVIGSYLAALTLLPALVALLERRRNVVASVAAQSVAELGS